jgi:hypothetical protein
VDTADETGAAVRCEAPGVIMIDGLMDPGAETGRLFNDRVAGIPADERPERPGSDDGSA